MRELIQNLPLALAKFETWFDRRFGWFFTNGMKNRSTQVSVQEAAMQKGTSPTA